MANKNQIWDFHNNEPHNRMQEFVQNSGDETCWAEIASLSYIFLPTTLYYNKEDKIVEKKP
ncbi:hypothetical protein ACTXT7_008782 [Hymenolepis weldensis]